MCDVDQYLRQVDSEADSFGRDLALIIAPHECLMLRTSEVARRQLRFGLIVARESYIVSDRVVVRACCTHDSSTCFDTVLVLGLVGIIKIFNVHHLVEPYDIVVHILSWGAVFVVRALIERDAASTSWNSSN